jgi:S1-C subfamily serine protease
VFAILGWLVACVLAIAAFAAHGGRRRLRARRSWPALLGLLGALALAAFVGMRAGSQRHRQLYEGSGPIVQADAADTPEPIARALRSNVMIVCVESGLCGRACLGSGVIVGFEGNTALILTNRHVVDPAYGDEVARWGIQGPPRLTVLPYGQGPAEAKVRWIHPDNLDMALVECPLDSTEGLVVARWRLPAQAPVGMAVFAIGNPIGLGWTYTHGTVSAHRSIEGCQTIQTDTAINPGNSGGGLYDTDGTLLGLNTWGVNKSVAEGLNFAILIETASDVLKPLTAVAGAAQP